MKLPNWEQAIVEQEKITEYLLAYDADSGKAAFFISFGFSRTCGNYWPLN
jgi:hypothetical protein